MPGLMMLPTAILMTLNMTASGLRTLPALEQQRHPCLDFYTCGRNDEMGKDLQVNTIQECHCLCLETPDCAHFTLFHARGGTHCHLFRSCQTKIVDVRGIMFLSGDITSSECRGTPRFCNSRTT